MTPRILERQLAGYTLTTAHILYRMPDFPALLQSYVWQDYDIAPDFPVLSRFLDFWTRSLEGPIHSVRVANRSLIAPADLRTADGFCTLH